MKKLFFLLACFMLISQVDATAQWSKIKRAARKTKKVAKKAARKTKKVAKTAARKTKNGAKTAARKTKNGAKTAARKTKNVAKTTARKTKNGAKTAARKTKNAAKKGWRYVVKGAAKILAASIRDARNRHLARSKPIPENVKQGLRAFIPESILNKARYAIGKCEVSLPNIINKGKEALSKVKLFQDHGNHAVTVGHLIVFREDPGQNLTRFWAHEMMHVVQYEEMGIDKFAFEYLITRSKPIEKEAEDEARKIVP